MIRISRLTDYGLLLLTHIAGHPGQPTFSARALAAGTRLPLPTVSKVLKVLTREGLLVSERGVQGGYALARAPDGISITEAIAALEGPIGLTECIQGAHQCEFESHCPTRVHWHVINRAIRGALDQVTLAQLAAPARGLVPLFALTGDERASGRP